MARESQPARTGLTEPLARISGGLTFTVTASCWNRKILTHPCWVPLKSQPPIRCASVPGRGWVFRPVNCEPLKPTKTTRTAAHGAHHVPRDVWRRFTPADGVSGRHCPAPRGYEATTAFLDIFSHRITTQYYRIWRKYAYPATFEMGGPTTPHSAC
jgi:type VI secretion system protein ImpH